MGDAAVVREIFEDPWAFMTRLWVKDQANTFHELSTLWPEQIPWVKALLGPKKYVLGLKPRQVGYTTWTTAYEFWRTYTSRHPRLCLQVVHDPDALVRVRDMVDTFRENLPGRIRRPYRRGSDNDQRSIFAHNQAGFMRRIAGAKGKARGGTYNDLHATEMAHWASATSAASRSDAGTADEEMFSSAMAALHDPTSRVIVESTGNGPRGLFYNLWKQARQDPAWAYVFVSWADVERYRIPLSDADARALEFDLDDTERRLAKEFKLSLEQIAWRRHKMRTEGWTPLRFKWEFPLTDIEPFLATESGWFDQEKLSAMLRWVPELGASEEPLRVFHPYEPGMRYYMGVDTAGGVRRDSSVIQVLDVHLRQVAVWGSNVADPVETAMMVSRIGAMYGGKALCLIEANKYGEDVIERVAALGGVELWKDDDDKDFWTTGGRAGDTKRRAFVHARQLVEEDWCVIADARTIHEMQVIVEKTTGKIEASGDGHDDYAVAYVLALWAARKAHRLVRSVTDGERDTLPALRKVRDTLGGRHGSGQR